MSKKLIAARLRDLENACDYASWREVALELDRLEGADAWKQDETSEAYDYLLIKERLALMRELRTRGRVRQLVFYLAEGLHGNLGNTANPALYAYCRVGTKRLIEEYVDEVVRCLDYVCAGDFPDFPLEDKVIFFKRTGTSFGRSALLLSGGATLGLFHLGVVEALWKHDLLPRVISGSSAGAIIAAMVCTRTDLELPAIFDADSLQLQAFQALSLRRALRSRTLMEPERLVDCLANNIAAGSFPQAFEHTRRILGVTVSPAEANQQPRLLNYLTAPHAVIRRAVQASCAIPGVFPPVMLEALDFDGSLAPYMRSKRWVDGTLFNDLPLLRLARLHNVNHYIVSQTNPHVVPFLREHDPRRRRRMGALAYELATVAGRDALRVARNHLGAGSSRIVDQLNEILQQRYSGDISILPRQSPAQLVRLLANPSSEDIRRFIREGQRATWPKLTRTATQTRISRAFENCLAWLKERGAQSSALDKASALHGSAMRVSRPSRPN